MDLTTNKEELGNWCEPNPKEFKDIPKRKMETIKPQQFKLYEPDFDNIDSLDKLKELMKSLYITMTYDLSDVEQTKTVTDLTDKKLIKEIKITNINNN